MSMMGQAGKHWRAAADAATRAREVQGAITRRMVLAAMDGALAPLSTQCIAVLAAISYHRARRALETLVELRAVRASGTANNRRYQLVPTGGGVMTGGPASASAGTAPAGALLPGPARPGRAA